MRFSFFAAVLMAVTAHNQFADAIHFAEDERMMLLAQTDASLGSELLAAPKNPIAKAITPNALNPTGAKDEKNEKKSKFYPDQVAVFLISITVFQRSLSKLPPSSTTLRRNRILPSRRPVSKRRKMNSLNAPISSGKTPTALFQAKARNLC